MKDCTSEELLAIEQEADIRIAKGERPLLPLLKMKWDARIYRELFVETYEKIVRLKQELPPQTNI